MFFAFLKKPVYSPCVLGALKLFDAFGPFLKSPVVSIVAEDLALLLLFRSLVKVRRKDQFLVQNEIVLIFHSSD